jgi:hypothetical protein
MDVFFAMLANPERAFLNAAKGCVRVSKLAILAVQITNRECPFRCLLDVIQLIGTSHYRDSVAVASETLQFGYFAKKDFFESIQFTLSHR